MTIESLQPFGKEIYGSYIQELVREQVNEALRLNSRSGVVVFYWQTASGSEFADRLYKIAKIIFTAGETPAEDEPRLNLLSNMARTRTTLDVFYTDTSYVEHPPAFMALREVRIPHSGGTDLFSDQLAVWSGLPERARRCLSGCTIHNLCEAEGLSTEDAWHSAARPHPETHETALYLSTPGRCTAISGTDKQVSSRIISSLFLSSTQSHTLYRHDWHIGDIVMWDHRRTMHRADHNNLVDDRVFHLGMVSAERPLAA